MITVHIPGAKQNSWPMGALCRDPGYHFIGITATGRRVPCTIADDGTYSADSHEVCRLIAWLPAPNKG